MAQAAEEKKEDIEFVPALTPQQKDALSKQLNLMALRVPVRAIGKLKKPLTPYSFHRTGFKTVQPDPQNELDPSTNKAMYKCILLHQNVKSDALETVPKDIVALITECNATVIPFPITLDYPKLSAMEILETIISNEQKQNEVDDRNLVIPTCYEQIGHIIHFNLKQDMLRYKFVIGQVYLDKVPNIKTVINKTATISNQYRVFPMEVIAGTADFQTAVKENGCRFSFDFSKVYWNSRLGKEHERMKELFQRNEVICDMMCGVGPFAIPAAKHKQCVVHANDLNPDSYAALEGNLRGNKVESLVQCYNLDGRVFWKKLCANKTWIAQQNTDKLDGVGAENKEKFVDHVLLNLPAIAMEFLDVFRECYTADEVEKYGLPTVHCYCFANALNFEKEIKDRLVKSLGVVPSESDGLKLRKVRNISPLKDMFCVSFRLPRDIAVGQGQRVENETQSASTASVNGKRTRTDCEDLAPSGVSPPPLKKQKTDLALSEND